MFKYLIPRYNYYILILIYMCIIYYVKKEVKLEDKPASELLEHGCDICPRTFKTIPGLKRHKTSHDRKPQKNNGNDENDNIT